MILNDEDLSEILGYFSLSIKAILLTDSVSNTKRQELTKSKNSELIAGYLIAQIARSDSSKKGFGKEIINLAIERIKTAQKEVAGRFLYLDCKEYLKSYYENIGFRFMQNNPENKDYIQLYAII